MDNDIKALNQKVDFLTEQVMTLTARLQPIDELKEDLVLFTNDAFSELIKFLSEIDFHYRSGDLMELIKSLLRNVRNFSKLVSQLESVTELIEDATPLAKDMFNELIQKFESFEKDGIFNSLEMGLKGIKRLYDNFSPEEIERMGDNHIRLIKFTNRIATADNLDKLEKIAQEVEQMGSIEKQKVSIFKVLKKARSQEVLQSLDLVLDIAKIVSKQNKH